MDRVTKSTESDILAGLELTARFAYAATCGDGCCSPKDTRQRTALYEAFIAGDSSLAPAVRSALETYPAFPIDQRVLGSLADRDPYDIEVARSYWRGGPLQHKLTLDDALRITEGVAARNSPAFAAYIRAQAPSLREMPLPPFTHELAVLLFTPDSVRASRLPVDDQFACRVSYGKPLDVHGGTIVLARRPLAFDGGYRLGDEEIYRVEHVPALLPNINEGSLIEIHRRVAVNQVSQSQATDAMLYSAAVHAALNARKRQINERGFTPL